MFNMSFLYKNKIKTIKFAIFSIVFFATFFAVHGASAAPVFYSVGQNTTDHKTGTPTVTVSGTTATFTVAQTATNMGVGDVINYDTDNKLCYISGKTSQTVWTCTNATGGTPTPATDAVVNSISHAFSSLSAAEAGAPTLLGNSDLTAIDVQLNFPCYYDTGADTTAVTIDGYTTDATRYIKIYTPNNIVTEVNQSQRHNGKWNDGKYNLSVSANFPLILSDNHVYLDGLQVRLTSSGGGFEAIYSTTQSGDADIRIYNSIVSGVISGTAEPRGINFHNGTYTARIYNNIIYGFRNDSQAYGTGINFNGTPNNIYLYNNTVYDCYLGIVKWPEGGIAVNNIVQNTNDGFYTSNSWGTGTDYNISDLAGDAPSPSYRSGLATDVAFVNEAGYDFHLAQTDTAARGAGANLTADANLPFSTDIDGQLRNPSGVGWDIGADEGTVEFVSTVMQSGGNFSTLSSWEDAIDSDLVADTTRVFSHGGITGTIVGGNTVTGLTSGATATVVYATSTQILLHTVSGIFQSGETLQVTVGNSVIISDNGNPASAVAKIDGAWTVADTTAVSITGWITGHDNYIKIYTAPAARHSGKWDEGKYRLTTTDQHGIYNYEGNIYLEGLQISLAGTAQWRYGIVVPENIILDNISINSNIIRDASDIDNRFGLYLHSYFNDLKIYNNIIYNFSGTNSYGYYLISEGSDDGNIKLQSNTFYNNNLIYSGWLDVIAQNNISQACIGACYTSNGSYYLTTNNISSDGTASGTNSKTNTTVSFVSTTPGAEDFHLASDDTAAKDAGTDLSTYFSTDIDGATRTSVTAWDIGADETATQIFRSVGPSATGLLDSDNSHADELLSITSGVATFEVAVADNIGVGDVLIYDSDASDTITSADTLLFIHGRTDSTHYTVRTQTGAVPANVAATNDTYQIYRAHTSLSNAEAGTINSTLSTMGFAQFNGGNRDLLANNEEWNIACYANGTTADTTAVTIDGWNTGVYNFIKVYTPVSASEVGVNQRHGGKISDNLYRLQAGATSDIILNYEEGVWIDGLILDGVNWNNNGTVGAFRNYASGVNNVRISNNIFANMHNPGPSISVGYRSEVSATGVVRIYNNIIYHGSGVSSGDYGIWPGNSVGGKKYYIHNNTVIDMYYGIYGSPDGSALFSDIVNNLVQGGSVNYAVPTNFAVALNNISSDNTSPNSSLRNLSASFISTALGSEDFHLSQSDTAAKNAGTDLSTYFSTDIDGASRNSSINAWDIGADETATQIYRSVGPSATGALATDSSHANTITLASGVATFSAALADNIGVGDAVIIDTGGTDQAIDASDTLLFIHSRTSSTSYTLRTHTGSVPGDISINDTYSIYRAYTSLYNAEAGTKNTSIPITFNGGNRDLLTNNEEWNIACYGNGANSDSNGNSIDGWDTAQQNFIKIYTPVNSSEVGVTQRHNGKWDENKWYIKRTDEWGSLIVIEESNVIIDGLQVGTTKNYHSGIAIGYDSSVGESGNIIVSNCILIRTSTEPATNYAGVRIEYENYGNKNATVRNCIIDGFDSGFSLNINGSRQKIYINNNTVSNANYFTYRGNATYIRNSLMTNVTDFMEDGTPSASNVSYLVTDGTVSFNTTGFTAINQNQTINFVDKANYDFHLAQADTAARGTGINLTTDANSPFSTDIDGQLRNPSGAGWDIGADEGTVEFVSTVMQSGGNFSTLSSWEDAIDSDLVADTTRVFSHGGITGTIVGGNTVTGLTSGATATVVYATSTQILLHTVSGIFQSGETVQVSSGNSVVISDNGNPASAVAKIDGAWTVADTTEVIVDGWISGPDNYIKVYTTPTARHSGKWDTTKYRLEGGVGVYVYENYVKIDGLQIHAMYYVGNGWAIGLAGVTGVSVSNNILRFTDTGNPSWDPAPYGILLTGYSYDCDIYNNIIYDFIDETGVEGLGIGLDIAEFNNVYNNTVINSYVGIAHPYAYFDNFKNNISYGNVDNYSGDFGTGDNSNNLSGPSQNDAPGLNPINNAGVVFSDYANDDFHLAQSDTAAKDAGTDLSTYFSTDIDGATRKSVAQQSGSDDFTTDPSSRWTNLRDSMTWSSGAYSSDSSQDYAVYNIPTITNAQYVKVNAYESNSLGAKGIVMRSTGTASDGYYVIVTGQGDYNAWITYADETGWVEDMASASFPHDFSTSSPGDSFGFTIEGSGTGTVARIWINPVNNSPFSSGAWDDAFDAPDTTITLAGYAGSNFSNTGKYLGLGSWDALVTYDNFYGGSIAETWDIGADETATQIFRSVAPGATGLLDSDNSHADELLSITSGVATFEVAVADNIGVGDVLIVDTNNDETITSADTLLFIHSRTSSTVYTLRTHTGSVPGDIPINDTWQIYRAHTSLANAEAGTINSALSGLGFSAFNGGNRDLLANNEEWNIACYANGTTADTVGLDIKDWYTAQQNFIRFYTPVSSSEVGASQRHSGKWDDGKYRLQVSAGGDNAILIWNGYVKIEGLQVALSDDTNSKIIEIFGGYLNELGTGLDISSNILRGGLTVPTTPTLGIQIPSLVPAGYINIFNNIIYDIGTAVGSSGVYYRNSFVNNYVYNNTIENSNIGFYNYTGSVMFALTNNITQNCTDGYYTDWGWDPVSDYNISDLAGDAPGANSKNSTNVLFLDESGNDFHLSQSDTTAKDAGTDLSTYFSTDIDGATRNSSINNWDIGADETATRIFRSVGPSATGLLATDSSHANTVTLTSGVATFSAALADNIGVGDAVIIDTGGTDQTIDASDTLLFIHNRTSSTSYTLRTHTGFIPGDIAINDTYSIYRAYTSLYNAEAGTKNTSIPITFNGGDRDLVTNNEEWNIACYANGTTADTTAVTIDGWNTAQQTYLKVYTPVNTSEAGVSQRHSGKWDEGKYRLESNSVNVLNIMEDSIRIEGLQLFQNDSDDGYRQVIVSLSWNGTSWDSFNFDFYISNNIIRNTANTIHNERTGILVGSGNPGAKVRIFNNIIYDGSRNSASSTDAGIYTEDLDVTVYAYNNTISNFTRGFQINGGSGKIIAKNNIVQDCDDGFASGGYDASSDYNISDIANDAPSPSYRTNLATDVAFVNEAGKDFHLAQTDTAARGAGANLTAEIATSEYLLAMTKDIDGQLRNPAGAGWDIGADEGTVEFVSTVMQSGGNFSTLSSWEDAIDSDLVADTTRVFSHGGITGTIVGGNTVTGLTSGATATVVYATSTQILLHTVSGIFQTGETMQVSAGNSVVIGDNGNPASAVAMIDGAWSVADTTAVAVDGWATGHDNYIKIYTTQTARHSGKWDESRYRMSSSNIPIVVQQYFVTVDGLQLEKIGGSHAIYSNGLNTHLIGLYLSNNILKSSGSSSGTESEGIRIWEYRDMRDVKVINNIIYDFKDAGIMMSIVYYSDIIIANNTIYNNGTRGIYPTRGNVGYKNNIVSGHTYDFSGDYFIANFPNSSNNISSDSTAPGSSGSKINAEVKFISTEAGNEDFHLHPDDRFAIDGGTDLSTYFTTDIDGQTRLRQDSGVAQWDIGADETATRIYRSVGPGKTDTLDNDATHTKNVTLTAGVATFSAPLPDNVGVGDVVIIDTDNDEAITSADTLLFIQKRNSSTTYQLQTHTGATPSDITINDTYQIYRAHTSLANAEAGTINSTLSTMGFAFNGSNRDLVANNEQWNIACYANGTTADTTVVAVDGWVTGVNNFLKIYTPVEINEVGVTQRHDGKWDDNKYKLAIGDGHDNGSIQNNLAYMKIEGLQISKVVSNFSSPSGVSIQGAEEGEITISDNIIKMIDTSIYSHNGILYYKGSSPGNQIVNIFNNLIYDIKNINNEGYGISIIQYGIHNIYNNTVINSGVGYGYHNIAGEVTLKNNIAQDCVDGYYLESGVSWEPESDYNISDLAADAPGTNSKNSTDVLFLDEANDDFRLSSDDTAAKGAGLNLSTDANLSFFDDIRGQSRPASPTAWSIGASEPQSAGKIKLEGTQIKMEGDAKFE